MEVEGAARRRRSWRRTSKGEEEEEEEEEKGILRQVFLFLFLFLPVSERSIGEPLSFVDERTIVLFYFCFSYTSSVSLFISISPALFSFPSFHFVSPPSSSPEEGFLPSHLATTGVRATVGGNLTGDSALCAA